MPEGEDDAPPITRPDGPVYPGLAEVVRELERYVDHQVRATEEIDDKAEQLIALSVVLFGGAFAVFALSTSTVSAAVRGFLPVVVAGFLSNTAAFLVLLHGYLGLREAEAPRVDVSPDPFWVLDRLEEPWWTLQHHYHAVIRGYTVIARRNRSELARLTKQRRRGLYLLVLAATLYATGMFILWLR